MSLIFKPYGALNASTDPGALEQSSDGTNLISGDMQRLKNLRVDENGVAQTRDGSSAYNAVAIPVAIGHLFVDSAGARIEFGLDIYIDEVLSSSGYSDISWSAIAYNAYNSLRQSIFALNGTDAKRIELLSGAYTVYPWGLAAPVAIETNTDSGAAGEPHALTGTYGWKYTYVRLEGSTVVYESVPSAADVKTIAGVAPCLMMRIYEVGGTDLSLDSEAVDGLRLYRTLANGGIYYFDEVVLLDGGTTYYVDIVSGDNFANDGTAASPFATIQYAKHQCVHGDKIYVIPADGAEYKLAVFLSENRDPGLGAELETDHDQPPDGSFIIGPNYNGTCFIGYSNKLYYCKPKQPEYWPATYFVEVSPYGYALKAGIFFNNQLYVASVNDIYLIAGTGSDTFFPIAQKAITGTQSRYGLCSVSGIGVFHIGSDGLYLFNGAIDKKISHGQFEKLFRGETCGPMPGVGDLSTAILVQYSSRIYFGYASASNTYPRHFIVIDLATMRATYYDWGVEISAMTVDEANSLLMAVDTDGYVWKLEDPDSTDDNGTAIAWDIMSKEFTLPTRAHFPRWVKYDLDASSADSASGELWLDGVSHQSHTLTANRSVKRRLVETGNGNRCALRVSGSGPVSIHMIESE